MFHTLQQAISAPSISTNVIKPPRIFNQIQTFHFHDLMHCGCIFANRVNYFSHYYFDHLPGEETHNFGLSLPDFVRNFIHGRKLKPRLLGESDNHNNTSLAAGTQKHFMRDKVFHGSEFFKNAEFKLNTVLKPVFENQQISRYWFAAHVFSEMMIDRVLMKQHPAYLNAYYIDLGKADFSEIDSYLSLSGIEELTAFKERFNRFKTSEYLRQYVNDSALIYSLNRVFIYAKAGQEWNAVQYTELQKTIPEIESYFENSLPHLLEEMK